MQSLLPAWEKLGGYETGEEEEEEEQGLAALSPRRGGRDRLGGGKAGKENKSPSSAFPPSAERRRLRGCHVRKQILKILFFFNFIFPFPPESMGYCMDTVQA